MTNWFVGTDTIVAGTAVTMGETDTLYVLEGVHVGSSTASDGILASNAAFCAIHGTVLSAAGTAFHVTGNAQMTIGATGAITGVSGLALDGDGLIDNNGEISGTFGYALSVFGDRSTINNTGLISSTVGAIGLEDDGNEIVNSGTIAGGATAISFGQSHNLHDVNVIRNTGTISSGFETAIFANDATMLIFNAGTISGGIYFGRRDDTYNGSEGTILGVVRGNGGDDSITMGQGRDKIEGGLGSDTLDGGGGRDNFLYSAVAESNGKAFDTIIGFDARKDVFNLTVAVTGMDAAVNGGVLNDDGAFVSDLIAAVGAAQLGSGHAVLFTPDSGDLAGHTILVVDANGVAGYQRNKDYVFDLRDADNLSNFDTGDFI